MKGLDPVGHGLCRDIFRVIFYELLCKLFLISCDQKGHAPNDFDDSGPYESGIVQVKELLHQFESALLHLLHLDRPQSFGHEGCLLWLGLPDLLCRSPLILDRRSLRCLPFLSSGGGGGGFLALCRRGRVTVVVVLHMLHCGTLAILGEEGQVAIVFPGEVGDGTKRCALIVHGGIYITVAVRWYIFRTTQKLHDLRGGLKYMSRRGDSLQVEIYQLGALLHEFPSDADARHGRLARDEGGQERHRGSETVSTG
mmetsp:Transcript_22676/g.51962  ORF Transcript_22676/g.51962 Transcript_22676/m.51962 type:complete len:254 (-) Transcript_22676:284-1045(-)